MQEAIKAKPIFVDGEWGIDVDGKPFGKTTDFVFSPYRFKTEDDAECFILKKYKFTLDKPWKNIKKFSVSKKIQLLRSELNMTNRQLCAYLGVSETTLKYWLIKRFNPDGENMEMLNREFEKVGIE